MSNQRAFSQYRQTAAVGTSALGQVVALYQAILRDFHRAIVAVNQGEVEKRVSATDHALLVIAELQGVLDFEKGGAAAKQLDQFYNVSRAEILKASVSPSRERYQRLIGMFTPVYKAWEEISKKLPPTPPREAVPVRRVSMMGGEITTAPPLDGEETISTGLWRG